MPVHDPDADATKFLLSLPSLLLSSSSPSSSSSSASYSSYSSSSAFFKNFDVRLEKKQFFQLYVILGVCMCKAKANMFQLFVRVFCTFPLGKTSKRKKLFNSGIARITQTPTPQFGQLYRLFPADKNDVLCVWRKKILMMIIIVAMIILIKILVIIMTKNTEKPTNIINFG